ncbi:MAG: phosphoribosylglycinamide formyltransferase [Candidatus Hydrogenedentes bacterium]|nr:phosphoribosylglycinamide formyltransferase [Candidatus Hydrogenedentota bacterium]
MPLRLGVLFSGSGTTLQNFIEHQAEGKLDVDIVCAASSRKDAYGLVRAANYDVPAEAFHREDYKEDLAAFNKDIWDYLREHECQVVALAGFMSLLEVPEDYTNRITNVHPGLIPSFCGKGMYGHRVHEAVLEYGAKVSGATVHFVDDQYDHGPIILQVPVPVLDDDTADTLAERVQAAERMVYPQALQLIAQGRVTVEGRRVRIR